MIKFNPVAATKLAVALYTAEGWGVVLTKILRGYFQNFLSRGGYTPLSPIPCPSHMNYIRDNKLLPLMT